MRLAALGVGTGAVVGMGMAINAASDFQEQMAIVNTIAGQTPDQLTKTGDGIRAMAVSSGTPLKDLTSAYYDLVSAGIKPGADALSLLGQANTLGIGGLASTKQTVDLLTSAVNSYSLDAKGGAVATDQFALAIKDGKVTAAEIADTFADVAPLARTAGVGIDEISASYATLTAGGVKAPEAMTQMNRAMIELIKPGHALTDLQKKMGVNFADIAKDKGLVVALEQMRIGAEKNHVPFSSLFGRLEGMKFALATTGPHFKGYQAELEKMHQAGGTAAEQAAARSGTFDRQMKILGTTVNDLAISLGTGVLPPLTDFVKHVSGALQGVKDWAAANPGLATAILPVAAAVSGLIVAGLTLGPILGAIGTVVGIITSPILLIAGAVLGLAAHFGLLGDGAKDAFDGIAGTVAAAIPGIISTAEQIGGQVMTAIGNALPGILATLGQIGSQILDWIVAQAPAWAAQLVVWGNAFVAWISPIIGQALGMLGQYAGQVIDWISAQVPGLLAQLGAWASAFVDWVAPMIGPAVAALSGLVGQLVAQLGSWASAFVDWIKPMIPPLVAALGQLAGQVLGWVQAQVPRWVAQLQRWASAFVAWIGPMIGPALTTLGQFAGQILGWIQAQVPGWAAQLGKWAGAFVGWIGPMIQPAMIALGGLMSAGLQWVSAQLPKWGIALLKWATAFIGWILPMIPPLLLALAGVGLAIIGWVIQQVPVLAGAVLGLGRAIVDWIDASMPAMRAALGRFINDIIKWFGEVIPKIQKAAVDFGTTIVNGILAGIGDIGKTIGDKLTTIPGVGLIGDVSKNVGGIKLPGFATGGVVPGTGPQLVIAHGGEQILNQGQQGRGATQLAHTTILQVDGRTLAEVLETVIFNNASGASSGFAGSSVTD